MTIRLHEDMKPRILQRIKVSERTGCWEWQSTLSEDGYGKVVVGYKQPNHRPVKRFAHRVAYQSWKGEIPDGLELDHLCRNRKCCNPDHLETVTRKENVLCGDLPQMMKDKHAAQTHCYKGHELSGDNLVLQGRDKSNRVCRICRAERQRGYYKNKQQRLEISND